MDIETAIAEIRQHEQEIQKLLIVIADHNGEAITEASVFFKTGLLWATAAAENKELIK